MSNQVTEQNLVGLLMDYESGSLSLKETLNLFSFLIRTGKVWGLQGSYRRRAQSMIHAGWLDENGKILRTRP